MDFSSMEFQLLVISGVLLLFAGVLHLIDYIEKRNAPKVYVYINLETAQLFTSELLDLRSYHEYIKYECLGEL